MISYNSKFEDSAWHSRASSNFSLGYVQSSYKLSGLNKACHTSHTLHHLQSYASSTDFP